MAAPTKDFAETNTKQKMLTGLEHQGDSFASEGHVSAETRMDRSNRALITADSAPFRRVAGTRRTNANKLAGAYSGAGTRT